MFLYFKQSLIILRRVNVVFGNSHAPLQKHISNMLKR